LSLILTVVTERDAKKDVELPEAKNPAVDINSREISTDSDSDDELADVSRDEFKRVVDKQGWINRCFGGKPPFRFICFSQSAAVTRKDIMDLWRDWRRYGLVILQDDKKGLVMRARVNQNNSKLCSK
jgi:hypothetical protein